MTPENQNAFALRGVSRSFTHFQLSQLSLSLPLGQIMGLVGPNGAGKSTTIRLLMGLLAPEGGEIEMLGRSVPADIADLKREVAYVAADMRLYGTATLGWHMKLVASIYASWDAGYAAQLLRRFNLKAEQGVKGLSHGEHVKALLLLALARRPRLLVLDEPTSGLDPVARHELLTELMTIVQDDQRSILFSSHNTLDVERICDQIAFIDRGRLVDEGELSRALAATADRPASRRHAAATARRHRRLARRADGHVRHRPLRAGNGGGAAQRGYRHPRGATHVARGDLRRQCPA
jgi:ABC-2 type transport system ATP-binding protein